VAEVIFPVSSELLLLFEEEVGGGVAEEELPFLSLTLFDDPPNQRRRRALVEDVDGARLTESASAVEASVLPRSFFSFSICCARAWVKADGASRDLPSGVTSTSSASRHHFLRRV